MGAVYRTGYRREVEIAKDNKAIVPCLRVLRVSIRASEVDRSWEAQIAICVVVIVGVGVRRNVQGARGFLQ